MPLRCTLTKPSGLLPCLFLPLPSRLCGATTGLLQTTLLASRSRAASPPPPPPPSPPHPHPQYGSAPRRLSRGSRRASSIATKRMRAAAKPHPLSVFPPSPLFSQGNFHHPFSTPTLFIYLKPPADVPKKQRSFQVSQKPRFRLPALYQMSYRQSPGFPPLPTSLTEFYPRQSLSSIPYHPFTPPPPPQPQTLSMNFTKQRQKKTSSKSPLHVDVPLGPSSPTTAPATHGQPHHGPPVPIGDADTQKTNKEKGRRDESVNRAISHRHRLHQSPSTIPKASIGDQIVPKQEYTSENCTTSRSCYLEALKRLVVDSTRPT